MKHGFFQIPPAIARAGAGVVGSRSRMLAAAVGFTLVLLGCVVAAQDATGAAVDGRGFELAAEDLAVVGSTVGLNVEDSDFVGNPLADFLEKWPADLVVAPVPGYSPQVGWSLALASGYFVPSDEADDDVAPSLLGGFYWAA